MLSFSFTGVCSSLKNTLYYFQTLLTVRLCAAANMKFRWLDIMVLFILLDLGIRHVFSKSQ